MNRMRELNIVMKYTGEDVTEDWLIVAYKSTGGAIQETLQRLIRVEDKLADSVRRLREVADKIDSNLNAEPGDMVYQLNNLGELQAENPDALIMTRQALIDILQAQVFSTFNA